MAICKFNIGDEVRRINHDNGDKHITFQVGQVGTVVKIRDNTFVDVNVNGKVNTWNDVLNLVLVKAATHKFKIGDKVIGNHPTHYAYTNKGWKGVVTKVNPSGTFTAKGEGNPYHNGSFNCLEPAYFDLIPTNNDKIVITHDGKTTAATMYKEDGSKVFATARCAPEDKFDFAVGAKIAMERLMEKVNPTNIGGFKVGDRVHFHGVNGTVICLEKGGTNRIGVEFDKETDIAHRCECVPLIAGTTGKKCTCRWVTPSEITHGEVPEPPKYWTGRVVCTSVESYAADTTGFKVGHIYKVDDGKLIDEDGKSRPLANDRITCPEDLTTKSGYFSTWAYKFIPIVEDEEKPLTIDELKQMDGQKVYVIRLDENGVETPNHRFCGWHTVDVKTNRLIDHVGEHYCINSMGKHHGYHAYRTAPRK